MNKNILCGYEITTRSIDFFVENSILIELKALKCIEDVHLARGLNFLVAYKLDKGLLIILEREVLKSND